MEQPPTSLAKQARFGRPYLARGGFVNETLAVLTVGLSGAALPYLA